MHMLSLSFPMVFMHIIIARNGADAQGRVIIGGLNEEQRKRHIDFPRYPLVPSLRIPLALLVKMKIKTIRCILASSSF